MDELSATVTFMDYSGWTRFQHGPLFNFELHLRMHTTSVAYLSTLGDLNKQ